MRTGNWRLFAALAVIQPCLCRDLACTVVACTGGALSMSGLASIVDPSWRADKKKDAKLLGLPNPFDNKKEQELKKLKKQAPIGGLALVGWGMVKLVVVSRVPDLVHQLARVNMLAAATMYLLGGRKAKIPGIPESGLTVLAGLYACVGLGLKGIPRLGPDRFPDRFLEHLEVTPLGRRLHLV